MGKEDREREEKERKRKQKRKCRGRNKFYGFLDIQKKPFQHFGIISRCQDDI